MCALQFHKITILITAFCEILATAAVWALRQVAAHRMKFNHKMYVYILGVIWRLK